MQLELLYESTVLMKGIAINLYFQLELSSVFLCHSIPLGALYFNGPKFSTFCNSEKNSVHLQSLSLSAFQRICLSCQEKNLKDSILNGSWFALMMSFKRNVLLFPLDFLCLLSSFRSKNQLRHTLAAMAEGLYSTGLLPTANWSFGSTSKFSLSFVTPWSSLKKGSVLTLGWSY